MPLTTTKGLLDDANKQNYAVCAFNAENLEMVQAIVWGAQELSAPVIIQTTPSTINCIGLEYFVSMVKTAAAKATIPVALHLDHGDSFSLACRAIREGYSSVMIDGSHLSFDENIALTRRVVEVAKASSIPVEAELGRVGGKEDDREAGSGGYTDPQDAVVFVRETEIDSLAIGIGTAHGLYAAAPLLDVDRLSQIKELVSVPLVLHGATGLSDEVIMECVARGINKINFATELRAAFTNAVREKLDSDKAIIDVKKYSMYARDAVMALVQKKIMLSGSAQRVV